LRKFIEKLILYPALFFTAGCASIDVPKKPTLPQLISDENVVPAQFFNPSGDALPLTSTWWDSFGDPILSRLIETALVTNRELDVAEANIKIVTETLERQRLETSYNTQSGANINIGRNAAPNRNVTATVGGLIGASWEYDAFGRIDAAIRAAELSVEAAKQARQDIAVIVSSETALAYTDLRGAQKRLAVASENAETQSKSLELLQSLFENGRATELDLARAQAQYRTTLADLPRFQAIIESAISRLAVLTGASASNPDSMLLSLGNNNADIPTTQSFVSVGTPEDLIRRRPDIRSAEIEISRLLALSDIERARLFPTISFGADVSALFGSGNRLDQLSSFGFGLGPAINWEGPDLRRVRADIDIADAQTNRAFRVYEQTVIQALSDVEIALSNRVNEQRRQLDLSLAANAAETALNIATLRFEEGLDDFLDVLDAQRTLLAAQDRVAENQLQSTRLTILVYRELGGI
jgi:multidrug efflux system outer membrane protein